MHLLSIPIFAAFSTFLFSALFLINQTVQAASSEETTDFTIPPTLSVTNIIEGAFYNRDITPRIVIRSRNLKKSSATLDGAPYTLDSPIAAEGRHVLLLDAEDENNTSARLKTTFFIDKTPPVTKMQVSGAIQEEKGPVFVTGRALIEVSAEDTGQAPSGLKITECRLDGGDRQPYTNPIPLSQTEEGTHILYCASTDRAGNSEEEKKLVFTVSNSPPSTVITLSPPNKPLQGGGFLASPSTVFSLFASGSPSGIASMEYKVDDGAWLPYVPFTVPQEGEHIINFRSTDRLGNAEPAKSVRVVIDQKPPVTTLQIDGTRFAGPNNSVYVSPSAVFKLTAASPVIGIAKTEYRIDNRRWVNYAPFAIPEEGRHLVEFRSIDAVGNVEQQHSQHVTTDATPPVTVLYVDGQKRNADDVFFSKGVNTITLNATDKLSGVRKIEYNLDGKTWKEYSPLQLAVKKTEKVEYRSTDSVGNEEEVKTLTIRFDADPPVSTIEPGAPHAVKEVVHVTERTPFTISATDAVSGVGTIEYRVDSGRWLPYLPFKLSSPGKHVIEHRSTDLAGNQEAPRSLTVVVDNSLPVTTISVAGKKGGSERTVFLNGKDPLEFKAMSPVWKISSTEFRLDEGDWKKYSKPVFLQEEGEYLLEFRSTDTGGNEEDTRSVTVIVDTEPPESSITVGTPRHELNGAVHIETGTVLTPAATDDLSGIDRIEYQLKGHAVETDAVPFSIATNGTYELAFWSIDKAGNKETPKKMTLIVSPAPTRFSPEDLLLANEIATPQPKPTEQPPIVQIEEKVLASQANVLPEPPPVIIETITPQAPPKKPFLNWTMGILQVILILGVMAL